MRDFRSVLSRAWSLILWIGPTTVLVAAAVTFWSVQRALLQTDDTDLAVVAERVARAADVHISRMVNDLSLITSSPAVRAEGERESSVPRTPIEEEQFDRYWQARIGGDKRFDDRIAALLDTPLSAYFKHVVRSTGTALRELALADAEGRLIAASVRTEDYLQSDDPWWPADKRGLQACAKAPVDCAQFYDIRWDPSAGAFGVDVVMPVVSEGILVGVLKAVVDPTELNDIARVADRFTDVSLRKRNGEMLLVRDSSPLFSTGEHSTYIKRLSRGGEAVIPRLGGNVAVRALSGPMGDYWVAVARSNGHPIARNTATLPAAWLALTVAALLLTGWAASTTRTVAAVPEPVAIDRAAESA